MDTQPYEKEHPNMFQLNIPKGNLLKNVTINIYSQMVSVRSALIELVKETPSKSRPQIQALINTRQRPQRVQFNIHSSPFLLKTL